MFELLANIFGYLLKFFYNIVNNYGFAIILFTVVIKLLQLPFSIKQQKNMKKNIKIQEKMKILQHKYKNDQEKLNQAMMNLYKEEKMSPFSGCLTSIFQIILILSIFYIVRSPLTFMEKMPSDVTQKYIQQLQEEGKITSQVYPEMDVIREHEWLKEKNGNEDEWIDKTNLQMNFLGLDLSKVPQQNMSDYTVYVIPVLYILSSFISIRLTTSMQNKMTQKKKVIDGKTGQEVESEEQEGNELDAMMQTNKMMSWFLPIASISIAFVAPLGLALYWLINNVLMIFERLILNKVVSLDSEE